MVKENMLRENEVYELEEVDHENFIVELMSDKKSDHEEIKFKADLHSIGPLKDVSKLEERVFLGLDWLQLLDGRDKPIITCLEYIREYLMKRIVNVQKVQDKCDGPLTPSTAKIFKLIVRAAQVERKWELSGIPCTHAVASIWDQANNGIDTGIPESYCLPVHWLTTWKEMYKFKINPVNGPQGWKKSDVPTTIIPLKPHPQIGRPPKKRKKSAADLQMKMKV
ncbi:hypothetical protein Tco_0385273 [Tanacetum coccineum]